MPYSILIADLQNKADLKKLADNLRKNGIENFEFIYCSSLKKTARYKYYKNFVFDQNENIEKIINTVCCECSFNNIIIIRKVDYIDKAIELINKHNKNNQIVYPKNKMSKIKSIWFKLQKFVGKIFAHIILPIDYGIILYGEIPSKVLKNISSPAILTKTNQWEAIEMVEAFDGEKYYFPYNKIKCMLYALVPLILSVLLIVIKLAVNFKMFLTLRVLYYILIFAGFIISTIFGFKWILYSTVGENIGDRAQTK